MLYQHRTFAKARKYDPTQTTRLRQRWEADITRRLKLIKKLIKQELIDNDGFGLLRSNPLKTNAGRFEFTRPADRVNAFMKWLDQQVKKHIFEVMPGADQRFAAQAAWQNLYIQSAYQKGLAQAAQGLQGAGVTVGKGYLESAFFAPMHADRMGLIFTRAYSALDGITKAMEAKIASTLSRGIGEGLGVKDIASDLMADVDNIGITRARMLARTEVISAHAEASINAFKEAGVEGVSAEVEFATARDNKVCPRCAALEGKEYTLDEAAGVIPVHPNCRCAWIPVVKGPIRGLLSK